MSKPAVVVTDLTKMFRLPTEASSELKQVFVNFFKGIKGYREQVVLDNISFTIEQGDFFGIVGRNGSGKSTLLKVISGIYEPDGGSVAVHGSLVPFIELGVGFNPELTGRENVYLNGALLGFSVPEINAMYEEIVEFAELFDFMEQKLKNYSSGMQVRLAFSIAIRAKSDILVLDEVLAVGDEAFQRKCNAYFAELKREKKTVVLVTHSMTAVQQYCNKAILLEDGRITEAGGVTKVAQAYRALNNENVATEEEKESKKDTATVTVQYENRGDELAFAVKLVPKISVKDAVVTFVINRDNGEMVYRWTSDEKVAGPVVVKKGVPLTLQLKLQNIFPNGVFSVAIAIKNRERTEVYADLADAAKFEIVNRSTYPLDAYWKPSEEVQFAAA